MSPINSLGFDIESRILFLRGRRVIIDFDLAELYGVTIKRLREQIRRNPERFPDEFMLTLNFREKDEVAAKCGDLGNLRFSRTLPCAFTEFGALMAANILNSASAIQASIAVIKAFVRMREMLASHHELAQKLAALEEKYDIQFLEVFEAIELLAEVREEKRNRKLGFAKDPQVDDERET